MRQIAWALLAAGLMSTPAMAQEPQQGPTLVMQIRAAARAMAPATFTLAKQAPAADPAPKKVTVAAGVDFPTAYYFRGILQENEGFIMQPFVDVAVAVNDTTAVNFGSWNSIHSSENTGKYYETDFYGQATFTTGKWKPAVLFTSYNYPSFDWEGTVNEIAAIVAYDDSSSSMPLSPKFTYAIELRDGSHQYFEAAIKPTKPLGESATLSIPVKVGFSAKDYYPDPFGYLQAGAAISVPLKSMTSGSWEVHGGIDLIFLSKGLRFLDDDVVKPVASIGISGTF